MAALALTSSPGPAGETSAAPPPTPVASGVPVLANDSYLRAFLVLRTPVQISKDDKVSICMDPNVPKGKDPKPLPEFQSPLPPAEWMKPDFDDTAWDRQRSPVEMPPEWWGGSSALHTATVNSLIFLRWKFAVDDPAKVQDLKLSLEYVGGFVAYLNGQELTRAHLPAGEPKPETLAEKYPDDLYVLEGNKMLQQRWPGEPLSARSPYKEQIPLFERRYRKVEGFAVPAKLLRKGGNVLALEIHRSPVNEAVIGCERAQEGAMYTRPGIWAYAGLRKVSLTAASGESLTPNIGRPKGIQVWNVAPFETIDAFGYGDAGDTVKPVTVCAARNSVFSGRLAVSSDSAIKGLKVAVGDLKLAGGDAKLPAAAVQIRYAEPATPDKCWTPPHRFNGLVDAIPAEIPVIKAAPGRENYLCEPISRPGVTSGAVASLWLTVRVPKEAKAGKYEGTVTVEAEGLKATAVPLVLTVNDWTLSDPKDFRQSHLIFVSQEAVAKHYGVPLWSDKHFELMGKSLSVLAEVNSREIPMNLGINFYGGNKGGADSGNAESMVRWVKQADGSFKYDFTVFDKYCDLVAKHCGKPYPLRLNCWGTSNKEGKKDCVTDVTVVEADGKVGTMEQPDFGTEESYKFWKPVIDEALKRLKERGWLDVTCFGQSSYCYAPTPTVVDVAKKIWPEGQWAYTAHNGTLGGRFGGTDKSVSMPVKFSVCVWTEGRLVPRGDRELLKPRPSIWVNTARSRHRDWSPVMIIRGLPEEMIMRGMDG
ncbi:MAG TPA: DUF6067 family protein, partial [Planctomycetota bacterium]|nr:DUF6067 family protein [Planctomycetota bacterium]